ncbi:MULTISPECIES: hypothetical protein [Chryseobacterium]|uniref:hypothetical protein n=1 Tax=Chryseobacterium TaxID=59732 RepID=UPI001627A553|nr:MULTISPECIES: hypothetical protein [Chryseobacterium]MDM1557437.1 hypothetical protein [Chryseobacterium indologenes]
MTSCNKPTFPLICNDAYFSEPSYNTGEQIYYQKIDPVHASHIDGVVLLERNGNYYKAIYTENTINIEWYRCHYKNDPNDEAMITQAIKTAAYLGATLRFDAREYIVNKQLAFENLTCFKLLGDKQHTLIKSSTTERFWSYYLKFVNCNNFIIDGIRIDQNKSHISQVYTEADYNITGNDDTLRDFNGGIYVTFIQDRYTGGTINIEIKNCSFLDLYTRGLQFYNCNTEGEIKITDNYFESEIQTQMYRMEHLTLSQSHNINFIVENNIFKNNVLREANGTPIPNSAQMPCGISASDCGLVGSLLVSNNYLELCGRDNTGHHRLFAIDFYDNVDNFIISNNIFKNTTWGAIRFDGTRMNAVITDNYIHQLITNDSGIINSATREIESGVVKNFSICNNIIEGVVGNSFGILLQSQVNSTIIENVNISNNTFDHLKTAVLIIGSMNNINVSNNIATNMSGVVVDFKAHTSVHTYDDASGEIISSVHSVKIPLGRVMVNNNNFKSITTGEGFVGVQIDGLSTFSQQNLDHYKNSTKRIVISDNLLYSNNEGYGVIVNSIPEVWPIPTSGGQTLPILGSSLDGKVTVSGNEVNDVKYGLYLRVHKTIAKENILFNCNAQPLLEDYTDNIKFNNYYNNIPV